MIGILCEKPSAARNFANALGGMKGTYNGEDYVIVNAVGHCYEFKDPKDQVPKNKKTQYEVWNIDFLPWDENDFAWKKTKKDGVASILKNIETVLARCDELVVGTDVDPSGEGGMIFWEIIEALKLKPKKFSRMYFDDESVPQIQKAFKNRKVIVNKNKDKEYVMSLYRSKWDYMSMQWTRVATRCGDGNSVLRQGRLKSAMVLIVGDALEALKNYKKIPSYQNRFKDENGVVYINKDEPTYKTRPEVPKIYTDSPVVKDKSEMKKSAPPRLIDLATLSAKLAAKGVKAKTVLATYQKMYEQQVVSYPRTEDKCITPDQFNDLLPFANNIAKLVGVDPAILTHKKPRSTHVKTGGAHGANRPGPNVPKSLNDLDKTYGRGAKDIYILLAKSYLAMLCEDYEYEQQSGHLKKYPAFKGVTNVPKKAGWKQVMVGDVDYDLDNVTAGLGKIAKPFVEELFPPKPPTPTMKWLMAQLEKRDVGTGATRTSIYADVTNEKSKYPLLLETKGKLTMTTYGEMSYKLLPNTHIGDLKMTEQLQQEMRDIAAGKANADKCLHKIQQMIVDDIETMKKNGEAMRKDLHMSDKKYDEKEKATGIWEGKEVSFNRTWGGHRFTDDEVKRLLAGEEIEVRDCKTKNGKTYGVTGKLSVQTYSGHKYVGFERLGFIQDEEKIPDEWCQHVFSEDEKLLLESGHCIPIEGAISKKGRAFSCKVKWDETDSGRKGIIPIFD